MGGHKCTFDGGPDWASGEDVSSSSENPYDPSYKDDLNTTGDDEALVNAEDEDLVDEVKDAVIAEDENLVDTVKDVLGDGSSVTEFLSEFISDYATCWIEWDELHGYRGDSNEDLRIAYEALTETMVLETDSSNSTTTTSATFGSDERAKYEEECNKIEGTVFWDYPDTTLTCEHDEGSTTTTVAKFADCYPDSEACNSLDEKGDAINEGLLKVLWQRGHKCTFDGGPDWASGEDVSSSSENPYDPSYKDDLNTTGDDEALVNAEDEDLVDEVKDAVIAEDENLVDPVKDVLGDGSSVTE